MSMPNGSRTAHEWFANQMRVCVDGIAKLHCAIHERFAAQSANGSYTICREPKFVGFLRKHKENWMRRVSFARLRFAEN